MPKPSTIATRRRAGRRRALFNLMEKSSCKIFCRCRKRKIALCNSWLIVRKAAREMADGAAARAGRDPPAVRRYRDCRWCGRLARQMNSLSLVPHWRCRPAGDETSLGVIARRRQARGDLVVAESAASRSLRCAAMTTRVPPAGFALSSSSFTGPSPPASRRSLPRHRQHSRRRVGDAARCVRPGCRPVSARRRARAQASGAHQRGGGAVVCRRR